MTTIRMSWAALAAVILTTAACGDDGGPGFVDAPTRTDGGGGGEDGGGGGDGGMTDDAGLETDGGGGTPDGGDTTDGGPTTDGGTTTDAGTSIDAGPSIDAGTSIDAGPPIDGGPAPDAMPMSGWQGAQMIENISPSASQPDVAMDGAGRAVVIFMANDGVDVNLEVHATTYDPGTGWRATQLLSSSTSQFGASDPRVAMNEQGVAFAIWQQYNAADIDEVYVRRYVPDTGWEAATALLAAPQQTAWMPAIAVAADGSAMAIYGVRDGMDTHLFARRYLPGTGWEPAQRLWGMPFTDALAGDVAFDAAGNAVATWSVEAGGGTVWAARFSRTAGWATPVRLDDASTADAAPPRLAVAGGGEAIAVWSVHDGNVSSIWGATAGASGAWQPATRLSAPGTYAILADVATDPTGRALAVWQAFPDDVVGDAVVGVFARRHLPASGWAAIERVDTPGDDATWPRVALSPAGTATVVWNQTDATGSWTWARRHAASSGWGAPTRIDAPPAVGSSAPQAVVSAGGSDDAVAVWPRRVDNHDGPPAHMDMWANVFR